MEKTNDYSKKQLIANTIARYASKSRNDRNAYEYYTDLLSSLLDQVMKLDVFAAKVAETIDKSMCKGYNVANVSSKQAWVIACAVVENGINTDHFLENDTKTEEVEEEEVIDNEKQEVVNAFTLISDEKTTTMHTITYTYNGQMYRSCNLGGLFYLGTKLADAYEVNKAFDEFQYLHKGANLIA